jgi:hypothetical protein
MKHVLLQFNYGVEIGARLAYLGHFRATGDINVLDIAEDEFHHRCQLRAILAGYGKKPSRLINSCFYLIGKIVQVLCPFTPEFLLNYVATCLEIFAIFSYTRLAKVFPEHAVTLNEMAATEERHRQYFS